MKLLKHNTHGYRRNYGNMTKIVAGCKTELIDRGSITVGTGEDGGQRHDSLYFDSLYLRFE